jgi:hypothetical protein
MSKHGRHTSSFLLIVATHGHSSTAIRVISPGPVATKGHNSNFSISPTLLTQIGTDPHNYFFTTLQIEVRPTDNLEIIDYLWTLSSAFCRIYSGDISIPYTTNLGEAMFNSFKVVPLVSDPK